VNCCLFTVIIMNNNSTNFRLSDGMTCTRYLLVKLETENCKDLDTSVSYLTSNIILSLQQVFGEVGAAIPFSVLNFSTESRKAILACPESGLVRLRTALTLQKSYQGSACCYSVERVSPDLLSLSLPV